MSDEIKFEIKHFTEFLEKCFGRKVIDYSMEPLTKAGDNYGSVLHAVEVKISGKTDTLHLVSKTSVINPSYVKVFQPAVTFVKENRFYSDILPTLKHFEEISRIPHVNRIDAFFECFGSRISLDPNAKIADIDALLLLENVKFNDFVNADRLGFDTEETMAVLKSLAQFHALCIALRRLHPKMFDLKVRPFSTAVNLNLDSNDHRLLDSVHNELHLIDKLDSKLRNRIQKQLKIGDTFVRDTKKVPDTPYTTIVHRDLWINNIMIKKERNMPVKIKIYDFQLYFYQSFVHDLIFFLFTSVRPEDLRNNFNTFINYYHSEFVNTLKLTNCPLDDFTFEKMWGEIKDRAKIELLHVLFMIKVTMFDPKTQAEPDQEICQEIFFNWKSLPEDVSSRWELLIDIFVKNEFI